MRKPLRKPASSKATAKAKQVFATGAIPSPVDYRDIPLARVPAAFAVLPKEHFEDISKLPVWHQRKIGACVGHAAAKYKQYLDFLETGKVIGLSPRFLYAVAKARDKYQDEGTYPRLVAGILKDHGCATEKTIPNDTTLKHEAYVYNRDEKKIPTKAWDEAKPFKIGSYAFPNVKVVDELKRAIVEGHGAMLLMRVGEEWYKDKDGNSSWKEKDIVPLRPPAEIISGHEVWLYGYETVGKRTKFYVFNSWSLDWGDKGTAYFWHDEYKPFLDESITFVDVPNNLIEEAHELPEAEKFHYTFTRNMLYGERGEDVKAMQTALRIDGVFEGPVTGYFGDLTAAALVRFWQKYNLTTILENLIIRGRSAGPKTRAKLNELFST